MLFAILTKVTTAKTMMRNINDHGPSSTGLPDKSQVESKTEPEKGIKESEGAAAKKRC